VLAFDVVFSLFVIATVTLVVLTLRWARRRERERSVSRPEG
jgi:membrane protein implicated in regulation of membrane protease activity